VGRLLFLHPWMMVDDDVTTVSCPEGTEGKAGCNPLGLAGGQGQTTTKKKKSYHIE
jgi:hypothetical protein